MQCPNCGAEISKEELHCPYCLWENPNIAKKSQRKIVDLIYQKTADLIHLPEKSVRKISRWLLIIAGIALAAYLAVLAFTGISTVISNENSYQRQQENLEKLEKYYQAGDYETMLDFLNKLEDGYRVTYEKYDIIGRLSRGIFEVEALLNNDFEYELRSTSADAFAWYIYWLEKDINKIKKLEENGFVYGEGEQALQLKNKALLILRQSLCMTDDEIEAAAQWKEDDEQMLELAGKCLTRTTKARWQVFATGIITSVILRICVSIWSFTTFIHLNLINTGRS